MNTKLETLLPPMNVDPAVDARVIDHFHASAALYELWSAEGHLHFGYWKWPMSLFHRKDMLDAMVYRVVKELQPQRGHRLADLGCGYGTAARLVAGLCNCTVDAFTVVPEQEKQGRERAISECVDVAMHLRDFRHTALPASCMDGVYALESLCYGSGHGKGDVLAEAARILKPGGRIALVDGFILKPATGIRGRMVHTVERGWAVPCFPRKEPFVQALENAGFTDIRITDLSWNVAPSAVHGLPLMAWSQLRYLFSGERPTPLEQAHLKSCLYGITLGTQRDLFRYLLISGRKH